MEFCVSTLEVKSAASKIFNIAPPKNYAGELIGVKILAESGEVTFSVNDVELASKSGFCTPIIKDGDVVVGLSALFKVLSGFSEYSDGKGTKELKFKKGTQRLTITAKTYYGDKAVTQRRYLPFLDTNIPELKITSKDKFKNISASIMARGLSSVLISLPSALGGVDMSGVLFSIEDTTLRVVSTNGVCLTEFEATIDDLEDSIGTMSCVLSSTFVSKVCRVLSNIVKS